MSSNDDIRNKIIGLGENSRRKSYYPELNKHVEELEKTQEALKQSQERLNLALAGGNLGMWDLDIKENRLVTNDIWYTMLGYPPNDPEPSYELWKSLLNPEDIEEAEVTLKKHLEGETDSYSCEFRMKTADGKWKWILSKGKISQKDSDGSPIRITGIHIDIHKSKTMADRFQQMQKLESIGRLAGGIAHDFNNLLTIILMEAEILYERHSNSSTDLMDIQAIIDGANKGAMLTSRLLAFGRKQRIRQSMLNINEVIAEMKKLLSRLIGSEIDLTLDLEEKIPKLFIDQGQLEQILMNLLVNARDALQENPPDRPKRIQIKTYTSEKKHTKELILEVRDWGKGMDKKIQQLIFDPFFTTKAKDRGTGLGLSTVYGIVKQMNGQIRVESQPNKGSSFIIQWTL